MSGLDAQFDQRSNEPVVVVGGEDQTLPEPRAVAGDRFPQLDPLPAELALLPAKLVVNVLHRQSAFHLGMGRGDRRANLGLRSTHDCLLRLGLGEVEEASAALPASWLRTSSDWMRQGRCQQLVRLVFGRVVGSGLVAWQGRPFVVE